MSDSIVKRLQERRLALVAELRAIAEKALDDKRELSAEERGKSEAINAEIDDIGDRIKGFLDQAERSKTQDEKFAELEGRTVESGKDQRAQQGNAELRAFMRGDPGAPRYFEAKPDGPVNFRDLVKGTTTAGGFTVPTSFFDRLMAHLIEVSAILRAGATVLNTTSGESIQVPKTTAHSANAGIIAEAGSITESDPVFGQTTLGAFKYGIMIQVARELIEDTGVDLEGYLAMQAGRALGNGFGAHAITGTGTGQPFGVVTQSTLGVTGGTGVGGAFTGDNLIDLHYSVIEPYRMSQACVWLMRDATVGAARKLKSTDGQYLWQPGLQAGAPDLLLGKRVVTDPNVAAVALSARSVAFGDFSQYFVRLAGGVRFERSDEFAFGTDLVSFRALLRADGNLIDLTGAVKHFVGAAS